MEPLVPTIARKDRNVKVLASHKVLYRENSMWLVCDSEVRPSLFQQCLSTECDPTLDSKLAVALTIAPQCFCLYYRVSFLRISYRIRSHYREDGGCTRRNQTHDMCD